MNGRVFFVVFPLVLLLMYPVFKPLHASIAAPDAINIVNSDIAGEDVILRVSKDYRNIVIDEAGKISFDLDRVMGDNEGKAFNTNARFTIGSPENPVLTVFNNSDQKIVIAIENLEHPGTIVLQSSRAPGDTANYYLEVNTKNAAIGQISARLQIR
jgi:hypothetical protein